MLIYIRESDKERIICNVDEKDIAENLRELMMKKQEQKEHRRIKKSMCQLYTTIKVARDEDLNVMIWRDKYSDLVDFDKVWSRCVQNQTPFIRFKEEVANEFSIPVPCQRFWLWAKRGKKTYCPSKPLTSQEEKQSVGQLRDGSNIAHNGELKLFLEVERGPDSLPIGLPDKTRDSILLFFKLYVPEIYEFRYVQRLFVKGIGKPVDILKELNKLAGFDTNENIELYEEINFGDHVECKLIDKKLTFRSNQLVDGDTIIFQKSLPCDCQYPDAPSFLEYIHNRQVVHFRSIEKPKEDAFSLELSKLYTYDDIVRCVAQELMSVEPFVVLDDPCKIRLTPHDCFSKQPYFQPISYLAEERLSDMLVRLGQTSDILYYEVLDNPVPEYESLCTLIVAFHSAVKDEVVIHEIRLAKDNRIENVFDYPRAKVELSHFDAKLRLLSVSPYSILADHHPHQKLESWNSYLASLRGEEIPEEENDLTPQDRLIPVVHFTRDASGMHMDFGVPFFIIIYEGETLAEIKVRVQNKLQVPDKKFVKEKKTYGEFLEYLGLEHCDDTPKRASVVDQSCLTFGRREKRLKW